MQSGFPFPNEAQLLRIPSDRPTNVWGIQIDDPITKEYTGVKTYDQTTQVVSRLHATVLGKSCVV